MKKGYVYIITNKYKTVLYTGVTSDLVTRMSDHKNGNGSKFSSKYKLRYLLFFEEFESVQEAIVREKAIKGKTRDKKIALIEVENPKWVDISDFL